MTQINNSHTINIKKEFSNRLIIVFDTLTYAPDKYRQVAHHKMVDNPQASHKLEFQVPTSPLLCHVLHESNNKATLTKKGSGTTKQAKENKSPLLWIISGARYSGVPHNVQVLDTTT